MKVIVTGATGMVGKAVLIECLANNKISKVLVLNRRSLQLTHPKLQEVIIKDFFSLNEIDFSGYDACYHSMGVSSIGKNEEEYSHLTYDVTKSLVDAVFAKSPNAVFNYVSGQGTDTSEKGKIMWARVKGKTENMILSKGFKDAYMFRIGGLIPEKGVKSKTTWVNMLYTILKPFLGLFSKPFGLIGSSNVGVAMINSLFFSQDLKVLGNKHILNLSKK